MDANFVIICVAVAKPFSPESSHIAVEILLKIVSPSNFNGIEKKSSSIKFNAEISFMVVEIYEIPEKNMNITPAILKIILISGFFFFSMTAQIAVNNAIIKYPNIVIVQTHSLSFQTAC